MAVGYGRAAGILAAHGLDCWAPDLRGFGASGGLRGYVERLDVWLDDLAGQVNMLRGLGQPLVLLGHSMGGLVACRYAETRPAPAGPARPERTGPRWQPTGLEEGARPDPRPAGPEDGDQERLRRLHPVAGSGRGR